MDSRAFLGNSSAYGNDTDKSHCGCLRDCTTKRMVETNINTEKTHITSFLMGKLTISMAIFYSNLLNHWMFTTNLQDGT